jgi:hypothetical protein
MLNGLFGIAGKEVFPWHPLGEAVGIAGGDREAVEQQACLV